MYTEQPGWYHAEGIPLTQSAFGMVLSGVTE